MKKIQNDIFKHLFLENRSVFLAAGAEVAAKAAQETVDKTEDQAIATLDNLYFEYQNVDKESVPALKALVKKYKESSWVLDKLNNDQQKANFLSHQANCLYELSVTEFLHLDKLTPTQLGILNNRLSEIRDLLNQSIGFVARVNRYENNRMIPDPRSNLLLKVMTISHNINKNSKEVKQKTEEGFAKIKEALNKEYKDKYLIELHFKDGVFFVELMDAGTRMISGRLKYSVLDKQFILSEIMPLHENDHPLHSRNLLRILNGE